MVHRSPFASAISEFMGPGLRRGDSGKLLPCGAPPPSLHGAIPAPRREKVRGRSSAGRALQWLGGGRGFDPPRLHQPTLLAGFGWQASLRSGRSEGCPPVALAKEGYRRMNYVYILQSVSHPDQRPALPFT